MKAIDISKKQVLDTVPKAIQQNNFTPNLDRIIQMTMYFVTKEAKETVLEFLQGTVRVL